MNIEYLSFLGDYYNQIDSMSLSINALEKLITLNPNDQKNLNKLANLYIRDKDYINAIQICDRVLENDTIKKSESEHQNEKNQPVISLKKVAEANIVALKEELFFEEELTRGKGEGKP